MAIHVAILLRSYARLVLEGVKTVESRLTVNALAPFRAISTGERLFIKASSGPYMATAVASQVHFEEDLTPERLLALKRTWNSAVRGDDAYWEHKSRSRYASFIRLAEVEPLDVGPEMPPSSGLAWFVLSEDRSPLLDLPLTEGALRNRYIRVPSECSYFGAGEFTLVLPDGSQVRTCVNERRLLQWRGWAEWFEAYRLLPGDSVRFVRVAPDRYRVSLRPRAALATTLRHPPARA